MGVASAVQPCGRDLLFDLSLNKCNFAQEVDCPEDGDGSGVPAPLSSPSIAPSAKAGRGSGWSRTASPALSEEQRDLPPWLRTKVKDLQNGSVRLGPAGDSSKSALVSVVAVLSMFLLRR